MKINRLHLNIQLTLVALLPGKLDRVYCWRSIFCLKIWLFPLQTTSIRHDLSQSKLVQSGFIQQSWRFIATQTWKSFGKNQGHRTFHPATCQTEVLDNAGLRKNGQCWARLRKAKGVWFQIGKGKLWLYVFTCLDFFGGRIREFGLLFGC